MSKLPPKDRMAALEEGLTAAKTLAEALPFIQIYDREIVVVKYGGLSGSLSGPAPAGAVARTDAI